MARAAGISAPQISRIEYGVLTSVTVDQLARLGAAVGVDVRVHTYPGPDPALDAGQLALIGRLRERLPSSVSIRVEVPLPTTGDQRAWDLVLGGLRDGPMPTIPIDAETRLIDLQAQIRRIQLKLRDSGFDSVILLVADTRLNRAALVAAGGALATEFPISSRRALAALGQGRHPGASAIVFL